MSATVNPTLNSTLNANIIELTKVCQILQAKISEKIPVANNSNFQEEMVKTHSVYQQVIKKSITNIQEQETTAHEFYSLMQCLTSPNVDLNEILQKVIALHSRFEQLKAVHISNEQQIKTLEDRIVELIEQPTLTSLSAEWWSQFSCS